MRPSALFALLLLAATMVAADPPPAGGEKRLVGEWAGTSGPDGKALILTFGPGNKVTLRVGEDTTEGNYTADFTKQPAHLDLDWRPGRVTGKVRTIVGLLDGGRLRVEDNAGGPRPAEFSDNSLVLKKQ